MNYRIFSTVILIYMFIKTGTAQVPAIPTTVPTPNAWNFTQYGKIPISYFAGLPSISVPLVGFEYKDLKLPIQLNYNLALVKPESKPGSVGLGWTFNFGGVVSRQVRGLPDEFDFSINVQDYASGNTFTRQFHNGYFKNPSSASIALNEIEKNQLPRLSNGATVYSPPYLLLPGPLPYLYDGAAYPTPSNNTGLYFQGTWSRTWLPSYLDPQVGNSISYWNTYGIKDYSRDEFSFSVNGLNGKFYISSNGEIADIICDRKVLVSKLTESSILPELVPPPFRQGGTTNGYLFNLSPWQREGKYPKVISGFVITDLETNYSYVFGRTKSCEQNPECAQFSEAIEYEINLYGLTRDFWTATSWHLTSLTTPDNRTIYFDYERAGFDTKVFKSLFYTNYSDNSERLQNKGGKLIFPSYLKRVYSDLIKINLTYSDAIQLKYEDSDPSIYTLAEGGNLNEGFSDVVTTQRPIKTRKLDKIVYSSYNDLQREISFTYNNNSTQRLMLNKVTITDLKSNNISYSFSYDESKSLPKYLIDQTDHWGYWNGDSSAVNNDPTYIYNKRQPVSDFLYAGSLKMIQYPSGGYTEFIYEPNEYSKMANPFKDQAPLSTTNTLAGGLRIKKIRDYDGIDLTNEREFIYKSGYNSTLTEQQIASLPSSGVLNAKIQYRWESNSMNFTKVSNGPQTGFFSITSDQPVYSMYDDYHIGYSEVIQRVKSGAYTRYQFTNHDSGYLDGPYNFLINNIQGSSFTKYSDKRNTRGKIKLEAMYSNIDKLLSEKTITYQYDYITDHNNNPNYFEDLEHSIYYSGVDGNELSLMLGSKYNIYKASFVPATIETRNYDQNTNSYVYHKEEFIYGNASHKKVSQHFLYKNGAVDKTVYKYPSDYNINDFMLNNMRQNYPCMLIEQTDYTKQDGSTDFLIKGGMLNEYAFVPGATQARPLLNSFYQIKLNAPIPQNTFTNTIPVARDLNSTTKFTKDSRYLEYLRLTKFDLYRNPLEVEKYNGEKNMLVMGYNNNHIMASINHVGNYSSGLVWGYTSFEQYGYSNSEGILIQEMDNSRDFEFSGSTSNDAFSGKTSLNGTVQSKDYVHQATIYVAAKKGGSVPLLEVFSNGSTVYSPGAPFTKIAEKGNWEIYKCQHSNGGKKIRINSNGNYIDELRIIAPDDKAFLTTYTFDNGLLTNVIDKNFNRTYYEYDGSGRLFLVMDQDKNILKKFCYNYAGQQESCSQNTTPSLPPCDANCGTSPSTKCINDVCETGQYGVVGRSQQFQDGQPICIMYMGYMFSDGSVQTSGSIVVSGYCQ